MARRGSIFKAFSNIYRSTKESNKLIPKRTRAGFDYIRSSKIRVAKKIKKLSESPDPFEPNFRNKVERLRSKFKRSIY